MEFGPVLNFSARGWDKVVIVLTAVHNVGSTTNTGTPGKKAKNDAQQYRLRWEAANGDIVDDMGSDSSRPNNSKLRQGWGERRVVLQVPHDFRATLLLDLCSRLPGRHFLDSI